MPELPDVESFRRYMDATSLKQKITDVQVRHNRIIRNTSQRELSRGLQDNRFNSTKRHGKVLLAQLDNGKWLVMHFGMTGYLKYFQDVDDDDKYDRLMITFENGSHLGYISRRMLGQVTLADSDQDYIAAQKLGPDALSISFEQFTQAMRKGSPPVKAALMKQDRIAGIGNEYSDEILFQSKIHPQKQTKDLDDKQLNQLYKTMRKVLERAIDSQADPAKMPNTWLMPHRRKDNQCPRCKGKLQSIKSAGRTAYLCPKCQQQ